MFKDLLIIVVIGIFITIILFSIYSLYYIYQNKKEIDSKWIDYKCRPYIFPFAGWLVGPKTTNPTKNFQECSWLIFESFFSVMIAPIVNILSSLLSILTNFNKDIQNIREMVAYMRNNLRDLALDIYQKLWDAYTRLRFVYKTFTKIFYKVFRLSQSMLDILGYSFASLLSIWNGPIGGTARFFCFGHNTPIKLNNGNYISIQNIDVGQLINNNAKDLSTKVIAIYKFIANDLFILKKNKSEIIVSGSHLLLENNKWIRVYQSKYAHPLNKNEYPKYIYNISTTDNKIITPEFQFKDYMEISNKLLLNELYTKILYHFNINIDYTFKNYNPLFCGNNKVKMNDGTYKNMSSVEISDEVFEGGKVLGIIQHSSVNIPMYKYNNTIVSESGIFFENNKYQNIRNKGELFNYPQTNLFSILTEKSILYINDILWRDYELTSDISTELEDFILQNL